MALFFYQLFKLYGYSDCDTYVKRLKSSIHIYKKNTMSVVLIQSYLTQVNVASSI